MLRFPFLFQRNLVVQEIDYYETFDIYRIMKYSHVVTMLTKLFLCWLVSISTYLDQNTHTPKASIPLNTFDLLAYWGDCEMVVIHSYCAIENCHLGRSDREITTGYICCI